ncbi:MAG: RNA 2',3'-cyclic phosphodiesterase [Solirubrobacteraceae bacterium]
MSPTRRPERTPAAISERARLFVALELPAPVRAAVRRWAERALRDAPGLRLVAPESLHVTLCFLGGRPGEEIAAIAAACRTAAPGPALDLALGDVLWLPPRRPRVLALAVRDPAGALAALQARLARALAGGGWYAPERRPYTPHVTVARVGRPGLPGLAGLAAPGDPGFRATAVTLYRSFTDPGGARYEALETVALAGSAATDR